MHTSKLSQLMDRWIDVFLCAFVHCCQTMSSVPASSYRRWYKDDLCALAFKVLHDKQRGPLVFLRIYSGTLKPQTAIHNINRNSMYGVFNCAILIDP